MTIISLKLGFIGQLEKVCFKPALKAFRVADCLRLTGSLLYNFGAAYAKVCSPYFLVRTFRMQSNSCSVEQRDLGGSTVAAGWLDR